MTPGGKLLEAGGILSLIASALHIGCLFFGTDWFRFFGAPEPLVVAYENGATGLIWMTIGIALVLAIWAAYAFSGAGRIARLPLLRTGLCVISAIYLLRGLVLFPALANAPYPRSDFDIWSSTIVLVYGLTYIAGTWRAWPTLAPAPKVAA